jgi:hypothetical protein
VALPRALARMAMLGAEGASGFAARTAGHVVARRADAAVAPLLPGPLGGRSASSAPSSHGPHDGGTQLPRPPARAMPDAAAGAAAAAGAVSGAAGAALEAAAVGSSASRSALPPGATPADAGATSAKGATGPQQPSGLQAPAWEEIADRVPVELAAARAGQATTSSRHVAAAVAALDPDARREVIDLIAAEGGQVRGEMAQQAARSELDDGQRDAFRVLAAATPATTVRGAQDWLGAGADSHRTQPGHPAATAAQNVDASDALLSGGAALAPPPAAPIADRGPSGPAAPPPRAPLEPRPPARPANEPGGGNGAARRAP